ncbi:cupin domain-containing protein [Micromonospora sp. DT53]|uniref:cupin domain-containing protein n=1 Tax=Micromonospora sp. DT53 TaxID=3393444 RepID=UPI003CE70373
MSNKSRAMVGGIAATLAAGATLAIGAPAQATPSGPGVVGTVISQWTANGTDYTLREITIPTGQSTGWHYHDGNLYGWVKQGTLSHFDSTCAVDGIYPLGSFIQEPSGPRHVHIGVNRGKVPVVLEVLYVLPHGSPFAEDAPNPGCSFQ